MKRSGYISLILITTLCMGLSSCSETGAETAVSTESITPSSAGSTGASSVSESTGITGIENSRLSDEHAYNHVIYPDDAPADPGSLAVREYFNLAEMGLTTPVKAQDAGDCWAFAAATAMESNMLIDQGIAIDIDPHGIVDNIYMDEYDVEGFSFSDTAWTTDPYEAGGCDGFVPFTCSNGFMSGDTYYVLTDSIRLNQMTTDDIKHALVTYGAVYAGVNDSSWDIRVFDGYKTMNNPENIVDHAAVIIGWDDNFPKEYFRIPAEHDGAWLVQNSRSEYWGNHGYYWMSYESFLEAPECYIVSSDYSDVVSFDIGNQLSFETGDTTVCANVFDAKGYLKAVGTFICEKGETVTVKILKGQFGELLYTRDASFEDLGYHTIELDSPLPVEGFTVVIEYHGPAPCEGFTIGDGDLIYSAECHPGESFVYVDGNWLDMAGSGTYDALSSADGYSESVCDYCGLDEAGTVSAMFEECSVEGSPSSVTLGNVCIKALF